MRSLIFRAPVLTASGYGVHSRQILKGLIQSQKFDISVDAVRWGETPILLNDDPFLNQVRELAKKAQASYDVSVQVTIPPEFQKLARVNVGVTAGIETDRVSPGWIQKANENVDMVIVPSTHSAQTYGGVRFQGKNGEVLGLEKPLFVLPEGADTSVFNTDPVEGSEAFDFPSKFNFLSVGLGLDKNIGEDRKNIGLLVKWFCERFKDDQDVGLVLKIGLIGSSMIDFDMTKNRIKNLKASVGAGEFPRIHLVHGRLSDKEMAAIYKHPNVKAYVTLTHGEGFGLPILEAAACGLPIIATDWSGHLDFLTVDGKKRFVSLEQDLKEIPPSAVWNGVMDAGSRWACVKEEDTKHKMKKVVLSYDKPKEWALELANHVKETYSEEKTGKDFADKLLSFLDEHDKVTPRSENDMARIIRSQLGEEPGAKTLLYTMPMSAGDVYISTAVIDALKKKYPEHRIYFATGEKYASILKNNPNVHKVIRFDSWMMNVPLCEQMFDLVFTPNLAVQLNTSNWVHGGRGRLLAHEFAAQCQVELGSYSISLDEIGGLPEEFIAFNPGPMKGQWESRSYSKWQEVVNNLIAMTKLPVVQIGQADDPAFDGVVDFRGKTNDYNQLAFVISKAKCMVGIDTATMHIASGLGIPVVSIFGSSYSTSTGPANAKGFSVLLDSPTRGGCEKACYKNQCAVDRENPCVNEVSPRTIVEGVLRCIVNASPTSVLMERLSEYKEYRPQIAGYTHVLNAESQGFPYIESIKSMLGFCDEVIVVDGGSTDGTREKIEAIGDSKIRLIDHPWDWSEPGMDGMQKAYGRAMTSVGQNDFMWQQDADEVVHEDDYQKIKDLVTRFPKDVDVLHLPIVELWGTPFNVRTDRHSWKWRLSRNSFRVTHGINKGARVLDEKTGKTYAKKGMSDGCEYVDIMTQEYLQHKGFYTPQLEDLRRANPQAYGKEMNRVFNTMPSVFHYSWANLPRKVRNFRDFWDKCWSNLYNDPTPVPRFPDVKTDEDVERQANILLHDGGEHGPAEHFVLERSNPTLMKKWLGLEE